MGASESTTKRLHEYGHLIQTLDQHESGINCMALSEDGSVIATGSEDKTARLWSTKTEICECFGVLEGHEGFINCITFEDIYVITGSSDKTVRKWDISTCECLFVCIGHHSIINKVVCSGDHIFSSSYDKTVRCWDFDTGNCVAELEGHRKGVYSMIYLPIQNEDEEDPLDNDYLLRLNGILLTASADYTAKAWNLERMECITTFSGHTDTISCMAMSADGHTLYTGSTDKKVKSWDIATGECLKTYEGHTNSVICLQIHYKTMYTGSSDGTGLSWMTEFGDFTRIFKGHKGTVICMKLHDGMLYTGCGDGSARVFEAKSGVLHRTLRGHKLAIQCLQVVEDRLFTASYDGTVKVWDLTGVKDNPKTMKKRQKKQKKASKIHHRANSLSDGSTYASEDAESGTGTYYSEQLEDEMLESMLAGGGSLEAFMAEHPELADELQHRSISVIREVDETGESEC